jgi:hypothetical protein
MLSLSLSGGDLGALPYIPMTKTPTTKVESVIALCEREGGCTLKDITEKLVAASFIADARAEGIKVKFDVEGGRYYV